MHMAYYKEIIILSVGIVLFALCSKPIQSESVYFSYKGYNKKEVMKEVRTIDSIYSPLLSTLWATDFSPFTNHSKGSYSVNTHGSFYHARL